MKSVLRITAVLGAFAVLFGACKKEENKAYFEGAAKPVVLNATVSDGGTIPMSFATAAENAIAFSWNNPEYKFTTGTSSQDVTYTLYIDTAGADFSNNRTVTVSKNFTTSFTQAALNDFLIVKLGVNDTLRVYDIEAKVKSSIGSSKETEISSNVLRFKVTPFEKPVTISYFHVPGNYFNPNWSPGESPTIGSYDGVAFEGYVDFPIANSEFKFTSKPNWDGPNYGDGGTPGVLSTDGGAGNLKLTDAGYYQLKVAVGGLTWAYVKTDWGIVGSATPGAWDNSTPLTYDATTKTLVIESISLVTGEFKFRANNTWDINLGADAESAIENGLKYGGDNIALADPGNYKVVLDLSGAPVYKYSITKL